MKRPYSAILALSCLVLAPAFAWADAETEAFVRGETHFKAQEWEEALAAFRGFMLDHPKHARAAEARYFAGICLAESDEPEQAIELLDSFLTENAGSPVADKALIKLGELCRDQEQYERAREVWTTLLTKHPKFEERGQVSDMLIDLLVKQKKDLEAAFRECERWSKENRSPDATGNARFMGAYCLTMLHRDKEADAWIGIYFAEDSASESALRSVIRVASGLANHHDDVALRAVDGFWSDFEDIVGSEHAEILGRLCFVLANGGKHDRARQLIVTELKVPSGHSEEDVGTLFDQLTEIVDNADDLDIKDSLTELSAPGVPALTRAEAIERLADNLREDDEADKAELTLRRLVTDDPSSFIRVRAGIKLAGLLADENEDRQSAVRVLKDLLPKTTRPDLLHALNEAIKEYDDGADAK